MKKMKAHISPFRRFPDHIILHILNKLIDLKTLCICKLVCRRFRRIIRQVDTVSFTLTCPDKQYVDPVSYAVNCPEGDPSMFSKSFKLAIKTLFRFTSVKSLCIEFPSIPYNEYLVETCCVFKVRNSRVRSFLFLSPNAIYDKNGLSLLSYGNGGHEEAERNNFIDKKAVLAFECFLETYVRFGMLLVCISGLRLLERISITDSSKKRMYSVCGRKVGQVRDCLDSSAVTIKQRLRRCMYEPSKINRRFVPSLELPVLGYVMKGVSAVFLEWDDLPGGDDDAAAAADDDSFMNSFGDDGGVVYKQKAAAYGEAVTEILKNFNA